MSFLLVQDLRKEFYFDKKLEQDYPKNKNIQNLADNKSLKLENITTDIQEVSNEIYQRYVKQIFI